MMDFLSGIKTRCRLFFEEVKAFFTDKEICKQIIKQTLQELFPAWLLYVFCSFSLCLLVTFFMRDLMITIGCFIFYVVLFCVTKGYEIIWNRKHKEAPKSTYFFVARTFLFAVCMTLVVVNLRIL